MDTSGVGGISTPFTFSYGVPDVAGKDGVAGAAAVGPGSAARGTQAADLRESRMASRDTLAGTTSQGSPSTPESEARVDAAVAQIEQQSKGSSLDVMVRAMVQATSEQRKEAMNARMEARQAASAELLGEAASMNKEAANMIKSAVVSLVVGVVASAASMIGTLGSAFKSIKNAGKELEHKAAGIGQDMAKMEKKMQGDEKALKQLKAIKDAPRTESGEVKYASRERAGARAGQEGYSKENSEDMASYHQKAGEMRAVQARMTKEARATNAFDGLKSGSELASKGAESGKNVVESDNKKLEADQKADEAMEQGLNSQEDLHKTFQESLNEMVEKVLAFHQAQGEAKAEGMQALTRA